MKSFIGVIAFVVFLAVVALCNPGAVHAQDANTVPRAEVNGRHVTAVGPGSFAFNIGGSGHGRNCGCNDKLVVGLVTITQQAMRNDSSVTARLLDRAQLQVPSTVSSDPIHPFWWVVLGIVAMLVGMLLYNLGRSSVPQTAPASQPAATTRQNVHSGSVTHVHRFEWDEFVRVMLRIIQSYFDHKIRAYRATHPTPPSRRRPVPSASRSGGIAHRPFRATRFRPRSAR